MAIETLRQISGSDEMVLYGECNIGVSGAATYGLGSNVRISGGGQHVEIPVEIMVVDGLVDYPAADMAQSGNLRQAIHVVTPSDDWWILDHRHDDGEPGFEVQEVEIDRELYDNVYEIAKDLDIAFRE